MSLLKEQMMEHAKPGYDKRMVNTFAKVKAAETEMTDSLKRANIDPNRAILIGVSRI